MVPPQAQPPLPRSRSAPLGTPQAEAAVHWALKQLWKSRVGSGVQMPAAPVRTERLDDATLAVAQAAVAACADQAMPEVAHHIGMMYASNIAREVRSDRGAYFTPPRLAAKLTEMATRSGATWSRASVLDPAAGFGALLIPALQQIKLATSLRGGAMLEHVESHVAAFEIDEFTAWACRVMLSLTLAEDCAAAGRPIAALVLTGDALERHEHRHRYSVILANPPYGRLTLNPEMREVYARSLRGHANLYGLFADLCLRLSTRAGVISLLIPTSCLAGAYFKNLRAVLRSEGRIDHLEVIEARSGVFEDVLQEALLLGLKRGRVSNQARVYVADEPGDAQGVAVDLPAALDDIWIVPRVRSQVGLVRHVAGMPWRLSHYGIAVSTGPLVWNRHKSQLADQWKPIADGETSLPILWGEAAQNGTFAFRTDRSTHAPFIRVRASQDHLVMRESAILMQRTTSKEQVRRLICAVVPQEFLDLHGGAVVENHVNVLWTLSDDIALEPIARILNSQAVDDVFRCMSGSVAVSAYELEALPLPSPEQLQEVGALMAAGATEQEIEDAIAGFYWHAQAPMPVTEVLA